MSKSVFKKRLSLLRKKIPNITPDTLWIIQPENRRYLSGFRATDMQLSESSGSLIINRDKAILITDSRYKEDAQREARNFEVISMNKGVINGLPDLMQDLNTRILGFEEDYLSWKLHGQISRKLRKLSRPVRFTPLKGLVDKMRVIKDQSEIRAIEASSDMLVKIMQEIYKSLKPGMNEKDIAWQIKCLARDAGADDLAFPSIVASGPNGALPHAVPSDRKVRPGEPIVLDVGIKLDGYCSDMTRTVFLGTPKPAFKKIYKVVRDAQLQALNAVKPGVQSTLPDHVARQIIHEAGFGNFFGHALGHGVGLATHEIPRLAPIKPIMLESGMVVTIEPGIYLPGKGGVRLEETVVIGKNGPRILTKDDHYYDF